MPEVNLESLAGVATNAAREAGTWLRSQFGGVIASSRKTDGSVVTEYDSASEQMIADHIHAAFPHHPILGEELSPDTLVKGVTWVVDPIDGTRNFAAGVPLWAVSIAAVESGFPLVAAIYIPLTDELYTAVSGMGTALNGEPVSVSSTDDLSRSVAMVDLMPSQVRAMGEERIGRLLGAARRTRMLGSVCCSLAYVASGRFDLYYRPEAHLWDVAAGVLLVREAGGDVRSLDGRQWNTRSRSILAANKSLAEAFLARHNE